MTVFYARDKLPKSIFLAGPTPRDKAVPSWRPEALKLLEGFNGHIYVPEDSSWSPKFTYDDQVEWEWEGIMTATVVLFWVPRELQTMPAFTTNVEYGMAVPLRNVVVGWPEDSPKNRYLEKLADRYGHNVYRRLDDLCTAAMITANEPFKY